MIQLLSGRCRRPIAASLYLVFYFQLLCSLPIWARGEDRVGYHYNFTSPAVAAAPVHVRQHANRERAKAAPFTASRHIGGPNSPEASSFKAVGTDNLVNLFTGDFSYSIPLLDVDGYPVNIFYNGGISMEQEASWVGLGWNINPGSVNRNMRGVPDDFDGTDQVTQVQQVKPNKTWGGEVGIDNELLGIKEPKV